MISVCCCSINARYEVESLFRTLQAQGVDFELCVTLDNRVNDGSIQHFEKLNKAHSNFKVVTHESQDSTDYLQALMTFYEEQHLFSSDMRRQLRENLDKYVNGDFVDPARQFLWLSSGPLYNKAVEASSGDVIIITPGDFLYLFSLKRLEDYVKRCSKRGHFYTSPPAIWARVSNQDRTWLEDHMKQVHDGKIRNSQYRFDSVEVFRDYMRCPEHTADLYLPDFRRNVLIPFQGPDYWSDMGTYCAEAFMHRDLQSNPQFHGFHIMTRKSFDQIGGFTEAFYGRAFADDTMTRCGGREPGPVGASPEFSVAWCGGYEILDRGPGLPQDWKELARQKDPLFDQKPLPGERVCTRYLHDGIVSHHEMPKLVNRTMGKVKHPVRIIK